MGACLGEANCINKFANLKEDLEQKLQLFQSAQQIYVAIDDRYSQSRNLRFIARTYGFLHNTESAIQSWTASRDLASSIHYEPSQTSAQRAIDRLSSKQRMTSQQKVFIGFCIGMTIAFLVWKLRN